MPIPDNYHSAVYRICEDYERKLFKDLPASKPRASQLARTRGMLNRERGYKAVIGG